MKTLSSESILTLLRLRSKQKAAKKAAEELADEVKKVLEEQHGGKMKHGHVEEFAPTTCAYKFVLTAANRSEVGWRDEWFDLAVAKWGEEEATKRELALMEKSKSPVCSLTIPVNEKYIKEKLKQ